MEEIRGQEMALKAYFEVELVEDLDFNKGSIHGNTI